MSYCILSVAYRYCPPVGSLKNSWIRTGLWIRIRMDLHSFSLLDPDSDIDVYEVSILTLIQ